MPFVNDSNNDTPTPTPVYVDDPAGGDLDGTYPNPILKTGIVTTDKIAVGAITSNELADASVIASKLAPLGELGIFPIISGNFISSGLLTSAHLSANAAIESYQLKEGALFVKTINNQIVSGIKVFQHARTFFYPVNSFDVANKQYVDDTITGTVVAISVKETITQISHGFVAGDVLYYTGSVWAKAKADTAANAEVAGIVESAPTTNSFVLVYHGKISGLSGLTPGVVYFLSNTTAGLMVEDISTYSNSDINKPVLVATDTTEGIVVNYRGAQVGADAGTVISASPTGNASGDLAGTYPSPTIRLSAVSGNTIGAGSILQGHVQSGYVDRFTFQTVSGIKTFLHARGAGFPTFGTDFATKDYVDSFGGGGGPAGGDLAGTYPNPTIRQSAVSGNVIGSEAIIQGHIASGYVDLNTYQTISGIKIFNHARMLGYPTLSIDLVNKAYVDARAAGGGGGGGSYAFPVGVAGGDLTGFYPDPEIRSQVIDSDNIADAGVIQANVQYGYVDLFTDQSPISGSKLAVGPWMFNGSIKGGRVPTDDDDLCNKHYVDAHGGASLTNNSVSGNIIALNSISNGHIPVGSLCGSRIDLATIVPASLGRNTCTRAYRASSQQCNNGTEVFLVFGSTDYDYDTSFTSGVGTGDRIQAPNAGVYVVSANISWQACTGTGLTTLNIYRYDNINNTPTLVGQDVRYINTVTTTGAATAVATSQGLSIMVECPSAALYYFKCSATQTVASAVNLVTTGSHLPMLSIGLISGYQSYTSCQHG